MCSLAVYNWLALSWLVLNDKNVFDKTLYGSYKLICELNFLKAMTVVLYRYSITYSHTITIQESSYMIAANTTSPQTVITLPDRLQAGTNL